MKVYVDTNDIGTTVTYKEENGKRQYLYVHDNEGFIFKNLVDHDKQVRKEVVQEIFRDFNRKIDDEFDDNDTKYITLDVEDVNFYLKDLVERIEKDK